MTTLLFTPAGVNRGRPAGDLGSHRSPAFGPLLADVRARLVRCLGGPDGYEAVLLGTSGTGAVEAALGAVRSPVLVLVNGRYSRVLAEVARALGHEVRTLSNDPFAPVEPAAIGRALDRAGDVRTLALVHCETTTGALAPLSELCRVAAARRVQTVVDAVGSAGAHPLGLGEDGPDWVALTGSKAVEGSPGLSFVVARRSLLEAAPGGRGYYLDIRRNYQQQRDGRVAHTVSPELVAALREVLVRWERETPARRQARYAATAAALRDGLLQRGFELVPLPAGQRSDVVVPVRLPPGVDFGRVRERLTVQGMEVYLAPETLAQGYFFLAALGDLSQSDLANFLDALATSCGLDPAAADGRPE